MSFRSSQISLYNNSTFNLELVSDGAQLCHGKWADGLAPPGKIPSLINVLVSDTGGLTEKTPVKQGETLIVTLGGSSLKTPPQDFTAGAGQTIYNVLMFFAGTGVMADLTTVPGHLVIKAPVSRGALIVKQTLSELGAWQAEPSACAPALWQNVSDEGTSSGTEGWVKYNATDPTGTSADELVYIHWDNPVVWDTGTGLGIDPQVSIPDIKPPCNADKGAIPFRGVGPTTNSVFLAELSQDGENVNWGATNGPSTEDEVWSTVFQPASTGYFLLATVLHDNNMEYKLGLRTKGSVAGTICSFNGNQSLRPLSSRAGQPSLRALLGFKKTV
jgi:hypothetical protein